MTETITIDVRIFASLREVIGVKKFSITIKKGITIREFLALIEEKFETGKKFVDELIDPDNIDRVRDYVKFMINGNILFHDKILDSTIDTDGAVIAIFPPIGGG
jgi:molybdopterin converting factor small subunit